jgi:hypothetical protein
VTNTPAGPGHRVFALLVGIDAYLPPVTPLWGCRNDIGAVEEYLRARVGERLELRTLYDDQATRDAVAVGFRDHLGRAGPGDVALFAYAGHGSEEPAPAEVAHLEPTGRIQTLLLHDCGRRIGGKLRRALADKELSVLLAELAGRGPHVAVVLDCCHSGGGTRDPFVGIRGWSPRTAVAVDEASRDLLRELDTSRPVEEFIPGALEQWAAPSPPHVALAACRSYETAKELRAGDVTRGAFSVAFVESLDTLGARTTYRTLLNTVRSRVERTAREQRPELYPVDFGGLGDALVLDGSVGAVAASFTMSRSTDGWEVDAGFIHGLRPPEGREAFVLACTGPDGQVAGAARVTAVEIGRSCVEPIGWEPADVAYTAVIADVPLPPAAVQIDPPAADADEASVAAVEHVRTALTDAVATAGPDGGPSPHIRLVEPEEPTPSSTLRLRVVAAPGVAHITRGDGSPLTPATDVASAAGVRLLVSRLEHVARWELVRGLGTHPSPLAGAVELEVFPATADQAKRPPDVVPIAAAGGYRFTYETDVDGSWRAPYVFIELHNTSGEDLFVCALDLTDRFRCHALFPTALVAAGHRVAVWDGHAIPVALPADAVVESGAGARDWLKVVVSDVDFDAAAFDLPSLGAPEPSASATRSGTWSTISRIAAKAVSRDVGDDDGPPPVAARWAADTVTFEVTIP